ncbi:hypothetical protein Fmac_001614 [Flemingia macrophylla]|uniref:Uncharacterized protein n=1 Tax=Flemingia macrophylla TaxID=520843 RepID=A0ABD1NHN3_9FABA
MSNEGEKRKHAGNDAILDTHKKQAREVTDEEVEEFSVILRRMNMAVEYFRRGGAWTESLEEQILQELKQKTTWVRNLELDLNETPQQE